MPSDRVEPGDRWSAARVAGEPDQSFDGDLTGLAGGRVRLGTALVDRLPDVLARIPWERVAAGGRDDEPEPAVWEERWTSVAAASRRIAEQVIAAGPGGRWDESLGLLVRQSAGGRLPVGLLVQLTLWIRDAVWSVLAEEAIRLRLSDRVLHEAQTRVGGGCDELLVGLAQRLDIEMATADGRLAYLARHDPLTGLANRAVCLQALGDLLVGSRRVNTGVAVFCVDLDGFAAVNDAVGPSVGDEVLATAAQRLRSALRPDDLLARYGGDEFLLVCEGIRSATAARRLAHRMQAALVPPIPVAAGEMYLTATVGIARARAGERAAQLIGRAETALHAAQRDGHGQVRLADATGESGGLELLTGLRQAMDREELFVVYQPVLDTGTGQLVAVEALLRWRSAGGGVVLPSEFIPLAETSGLIVPIGAWVLEEACREAGRLSTRFGRPVRMAVNVSARQLTEPGFDATVRAALRQSGLPPGQLMLELTESLFLDPGATERVLGGLKGLGVNLAIDDFGTGYSSLSYLRRFPIDWVKLDRSLLSSDRAAPEQVLFAGTIHLAHQMGMRVVAEGVETAAELDAAQHAGCDAVQGYLLGRPAEPGALVPDRQALLHSTGHG